MVKGWNELSEQHVFDNEFVPRICKSLLQVFNKEKNVSIKLAKMFEVTLHQTRYLNDN